MALAEISKKWLLLGSFGVAMVVNPYLGCSSDDEEEFTYSEQDMKAVVLGDWEGTADLDGTSVPFTLTLEQASAKSKTQSVAAPTSKPQCASRSFVKPAAACTSETVMPLVGTITSANPALNGSISGELVAARNLESAGLRLELEDGKSLSGSLDSDSISDGRIWASVEVGSFSLSRP